MRSEFEKDPTAKELAKEFFDKPLIDRFYTNVGEYIFNHQQSKVDELQKRVDAVKQLIEDYRDPPTEDKTFQHALSIVADELEQALKGGGE